MGDFDWETVKWLEQSLPIWSKNAAHIFSFSFTPSYLEEMAKSYTIKSEELWSISPEADKTLMGVGTNMVECYLFNHRYADGSFFKMQLNCERLSLIDGKFAGIHLIAPWQELIDSGAIKIGTCVDIYGYMEEGRLVFVLRRSDMDDLDDTVQVRGYMKGPKRARFVLTKTDTEPYRCTVQLFEVKFN